MRQVDTGRCEQNEVDVELRQVDRYKGIITGRETDAQRQVTRERQVNM